MFPSYVPRVLVGVPTRRGESSAPQSAWCSGTERGDNRFTPPFTRTEGHGDEPKARARRASSMPIPPAIHGRRATPHADTPLHHKHGGWAVGVSPTNERRERRSSLQAGGHGFESRWLHSQTTCKVACFGTISRLGASKKCDGHHDWASLGRRGHRRPFRYERVLGALWGPVKGRRRLPRSRADAVGPDRTGASAPGGWSWCDARCRSTREQRGCVPWEDSLRVMCSRSPGGSNERWCRRHVWM